MSSTVMEYDAFLAEVRRRVGLRSQDDAARAARATLQTLAERLSGGEARNLASHVPEPVRAWLHDGEQPEPFGVDEFLHRVARREGVAEPEAAHHALAVFEALGSTVDPDELRDVEAELPKDFRLLVAVATVSARPSGDDAPIPEATFLLRVVAHGQLDLDTALRAAPAVLEVLGERISPGQVKDLAARLPDDLADALRRGDRRSKGQIRPLALEEFVRHVADLEGVSPATARAHARAVLLALRDVVDEKEFGDTLAQLPAEYRRLLEEDGRGPQPAADRASDGRAAPLALMPETVDIHAPDTVSRTTVAAARERVAELQRYTDLPLIGARLTLRHPETRAPRPGWIADASVLLDGRLLAAHATGPTALEAADAVVERLRRQIRRAVESDVAMRDEPRTIAKALAGLRAEAAARPAGDLMPARPGDRRLVHRITVPATPVRVAEAAADLVDGDLEFRLFLDKYSGDWLLVHRRDDDRIGVMHPPWTRLPDMVSDVFVVEPPEQPQPRTLEDTMAELERSGERFAYFIDAADNRPKVLYLRLDGDYGLVEPERTP
jgi:uncharacterized protein (DUF2267 family)/ribosome-associated translation inhibitor RaiA